MRRSARACKPFHRNKWSRGPPWVAALCVLPVGSEAGSKGTSLVAPAWYRNADKCHQDYDNAWDVHGCLLIATDEKADNPHTTLEKRHEERVPPLISRIPLRWIILEFKGHAAVVVGISGARGE